MSAKGLYDSAKQLGIQPTDLIKARQEMRSIGPQPARAAPAGGGFPISLPQLRPVKTGASNNMESQKEAFKSKSPWAHIKLRSVNLFTGNK